MDDSVSELVGCLGLYSLCLVLLKYCRGLATGDLDVVVVSDTGLADRPAASPLEIFAMSQIRVCTVFFNSLISSACVCRVQ